MSKIIIDPERKCVILTFNIGPHLGATRFHSVLSLIREACLEQNRPKGVMVFAVTIIVTSLGHMITLLDLEHYRYLFYPIPEQLLLLRYFVSWALRIVGLACGIGLLCKSNLSRITALYLFLFTALTVSLKHPYQGFKRHAIYLDQLVVKYGNYPARWGGQGIPSFSSVAKVSAIVIRIIDFLFAAAFIFYFTRPKIRKYFTKNSSCGLLEDFLTEKRSLKADVLIPAEFREGKILDVGCGITPTFLLNTKFKRKYGLDLMIENQLPQENIFITKLDLEKEPALPFEDNFFDVVTMLAVFEHLEPGRLIGVLKEIRRILKPKGRFVVTTPCPWSAKLIALMAKLRLIDPKKARGHKRAYGKNAIIRYLNEADFEKSKICFGRFELFLNSWAYADK